MIHPLSTASSPLLTRVGNYDLEGVLGTGGMADVYLGRDRRHGQLAAIKVLHASLADTPAVRSRFVNEARLAAAIHHPHVVAVHEAGEADGAVYMAMEYLDGETLGQVIQARGRMPARTATAIARQIAEALAAAHAASVVHRDLKPSNVMLVGESREWVRVVDFGIAKLLDAEAERMSELTRTGWLIGTPTYMSPEQCKDPSSIDRRSDIYSLGCAMYYMLAGRPPFDADSMAEVIGMQLYMQPRPIAQVVPEVPPALAELVRSCLRKRRSERPQSMEEVIEWLDSARRSRTPVSVPVHSTPVPGPTGPPVRAAGSTPALALPTAAMPVPSEPPAQDSAPAARRRLWVIGLSFLAALAIAFAGALTRHFTLRAREHGRVGPAVSTPVATAADEPMAAPLLRSLSIPTEIETSAGQAANPAPSVSADAGVGTEASAGDDDDDDDRDRSRRRSRRSRRSREPSEAAEASPPAAPGRGRTLDPFEKYDQPHAPPAAPRR